MRGFAVIAALGTFLGAIVCAPATWADKTGVRLEVLRTSVSQGVYRQSFPASAGGSLQPKGEAQHMYYAVGSYDDKGLAVASDNEKIGSEQSESELALLKRYPDVWWIEARLVKVEDQSVRVELAWRHTHAPRRESARRVGGGTRQVSLRTGGRHVFDFHSRSIVSDEYIANFVFSLAHVPARSASAAR